MAKYWKTRVSLFGDRAFNPMRLDGGTLSEEEVYFMQGSFESVYALPNDAHGRAVLFMDKRKSLFKSLNRKSILRIFWYLVHAALEDPSVQLSGFVLVFNAELSSVKEFDRGFVKNQVESIRKALPMKVCAIHVCHASGLMKMVLPFYKHMIGKKMRLRLCVHKTDVEAALAEYGLETESLPSILGGTYDAKTWMVARQEEESKLVNPAQ